LASWPNYSRQRSGRAAGIAANLKRTEHRQHQRKKARRGSESHEASAEGRIVKEWVSNVLNKRELDILGDKAMKNESERLAEPFDERANEDSYFAVQEHELIEQMKSEHQKVEGAKRQALMATCPKCSGKLAKYPVKGFVVERCDNCEGMWLNKGELAEILRRQSGGPLGAFLERCFAKVEVAKRS
jgi:TFIIB-like protein